MSIKKTAFLSFILGFYLIWTGCAKQTLKSPVIPAQTEVPSSKSGLSAESDLYKRLLLLPDAEIKKISPGSQFKEAYEIFLAQPLNHNDPYGETFPQRIYLSHTDYSKPAVMVTAGYGIRRNRSSELTRILGSNQIYVENRFFGKSSPDSVQWQFLDVKQASADHHRIITLFKKIYPGKWISTGVSKGGQTALYHRRYYPDDVDVTVPYVAPLNFSQTDKRIYTFLDTVGDAECRKKIHDFQVNLLIHREQILPLFKWYSIGRGHTFSIGTELAFEYSVLEYSFSFWQNGRNGCSSIPDEDASIDDLFDHFRKTVPFSLYSDKGVKNLWPASYQFAKELGYYGFDTMLFKGLLKAMPDNPDHTIFAPPGVDLTYNPEINLDVNEWLQNNGDHIIYIYGGNDTWSATAVQLTGKTNALKMVKEGGNHSTRIRDFSEEDKEKIYSTLEEWLNLKIER